MRFLLLSAYEQKTGIQAAFTGVFLDRLDDAPDAVTIVRGRGTAQFGLPGHGD